MYTGNEIEEKINATELTEISFYSSEERNYRDTYIKLSALYPIKRINFLGEESLSDFEEIKKFCFFLRDYCAAGDKEMPDLRIMTSEKLLTEEIFRFLQEFRFKITVSIEAGQIIRGSFSEKYNSVDGVNLFQECVSILPCEKIKQMDEAAFKSYLDFCEKLSCDRVAVLLSDDGRNKDSGDAAIIKKIDEFYNFYAKYCISRILDGTLKKYHVSIIGIIIAVLRGGNRSLCEAGIGQIYVDGNGDIYPCRHFCMEGERMGNISRPEGIAAKIEEQRKKYKERLNKKCGNCALTEFCDEAICIGNTAAIAAEKIRDTELWHNVNKIRCNHVIKEMYDVTESEKNTSHFVEQFTRYIKRITGTPAPEK